MAIILSPNISMFYGTPVHPNVDLTLKNQFVVGQAHVEVYRSAAERARKEHLTIYGLLDGSEVRLMDAATGVEIPGGVETSSAPDITFTYQKPAVSTPVRLLIILAGYRIISQIYYTGLGDLTQTVFYSPDPTYVV